jgi:hypothetical protein
VTPGGSEAVLRYFATVPVSLEPELCVSIFSAELDALMEARGRVNRAGGLLELMPHSVADRNPTASQYDSALSEHSLAFLQATDDWIEDHEGRRIVRPEHKIGGRPHLVRDLPVLVDALKNLEAEGYSLMAQFDFPCGEDALVSGDWPFADGIFALLGRSVPSGWDWRWYWDY